MTISALMHLVLGTAITGGSAHRPIASLSLPDLTAQLSYVSSIPAVESLPDRDAAVAASPAPLRPAAPRAKATAPDSPAPAPLRTGSDAVAEAPDLTYYATKQLDVFPALSTALDLAQVTDAAAAGTPGRALLLVLIDANGVVNEVSVVEAEPAAYSADHAKRAVMTARFTPGYRNGRPVRSRLLVEVNYGRPVAE